MNLDIQNLSKQFQPPTWVLKDMNLTLEAGKFSGLLGPSGCGKTTLLRIIAGLEEPTTGSVKLGGEFLVDSKSKINLPPEKRKIGMVFQSYAVWPHLNVFENIAFPLRVRGLKLPEIESKVMPMLKCVQLEGFEKRNPSQLSGGQQQRVALARALVQEPRLLLLDEPLSNLDANLRASMRSEIRELQKELNITAIIVTHDWKDARDLCDEVVIFQNGQVERKGTPSEIERNPGSDFVKSLLV